MILGCFLMWINYLNCSRKCANSIFVIRKNRDKETRPAFQNEM